MGKTVGSFSISGGRGVAASRVMAGDGISVNGETHPHPCPPLEGEGFSRFSFEMSRGEGFSRFSFEMSRASSTRAHQAKHTACTPFEAERTISNSPPQAERTISNPPLQAEPTLLSSSLHTERGLSNPPLQGGERRPSRTIGSGRLERPTGRTGMGGDGFAVPLNAKNTPDPDGQQRSLSPFAATQKKPTSRNLGTSLTEPDQSWLNPTGGKRQASGSRSIRPNRRRTRRARHVRHLHPMRSTNSAETATASRSAAASRASARSTHEIRIRNECTAGRPFRHCGGCEPCLECP